MTSWGQPHVSGGLPIGALSRQTATKVETIRYYEQIGLLQAPARTDGNQRRYSAADAERLAFIRHARELGFSLEAIRELLLLTDRPECSCAVADELATRQLAAVRSRIARLKALEKELARMVRECSKGQVANCRVIEVLADHRHCLTNHHGREKLDAERAPVDRGPDHGGARD